MTRPLSLLALMWILGCNAKLAKHVGEVDDFSVKVRHEQVQPGVSLGELANSEPEQEGVARKEVLNSGANVAIDAFEQGFTMRLSSLMDLHKMAKKVGKSTRTSLDKAGPFPLDQKSDWSMELMITQWGVGSGLSGAAQAEMRIYAGFFTPAGERIWKKSVGCTWDLAPNISWNTAQVTTNLATLTAMPDRKLKQTYMDLSAACGRALANAFREDVNRAKAKKNRQ